MLPLRAKRKVVEVFLTGKRLTEEVLVLEDEMRRFLCYYRDKVIPDLSSRLDSLDNGMCCYNDYKIFNNYMNNIKNLNIFQDDLPTDDLPVCSVQLDEVQCYVEDDFQYLTIHKRFLAFSLNERSLAPVSGPRNILYGFDAVSVNKCLIYYVLCIFRESTNSINLIKLQWLVRGLF